MHGEVVDVEAGGDEGVEIGHDRSAEIHEHAPVVHVDHLTCRRQANNTIRTGQWHPREEM